MIMLCSHCQCGLTDLGQDLYCVSCKRSYHKTAYCPECQAALQVLKACGAVDYFCQQHGLVSSSRVVWRAEEFPADS